MSFICPACKQATLAIVKSIELGANEHYDESSFQIINCSNCNFKGIAIYEESRRGSMESVHHYGYHVIEDVYNNACRDIENNLLQNYDYYINKDDKERFWMEYKK